MLYNSATLSGEAVGTSRLNCLKLGS